MTGKIDKSLEQLFLLGRPLSPVYSFLMSMRSTLFRKGIFEQHKLEVPVISVGNIVLGGTGKTPLVHHIAELLHKYDMKPAILSRGYKGSATNKINVVSEPSGILLDAKAAGDEPRLLAEKLPGTPIITGKNRFSTGRFAIDSFGSDVLILDDGFQHLALKRDLDLVLFSAQKRLGNARVMPGGELREPLSALKRADAFVITGVEVPLSRDIKAFIGLLGMWYPEKPIFTGAYQPEKMFFRLHKGNFDSITHEDARSIPLYGFCGIARPESFNSTLKTSGINLTGFQAFADHYIYTADNICQLLDNAKNSGASGLVTTEKDMVKLRPFFPQELPLIVLPVHLRLAEDFDRFLTSRLANLLDR